MAFKVEGCYTRIFIFLIIEIEQLMRPLKSGVWGLGFGFDSDGNVIDYKMVLQGTTMNCGGGRTVSSWL